MTDPSPPNTSAPVKLVLERRVKPGAHAPFESWLHRLLAAAERSATLQGSSVLHSGNDDYVVLLRFADQGALDRWQASAEVVELFREGAEHATSAERPVVRSGLETWFALPGHAPASVPPRWKMALVTWCALLPQVILLGFLLPKMPFPLGPAVGTAIPVMMLTWVIMPRLTKLLAPWLFPKRAPPPRGT